MGPSQDTGNASLAGNFLVASPHAKQEYRRCVLLLLAHDEDGAQGILLNHELLRSLGRLEQHLGGLNNRLRSSLAVPVELKVRVVRWASGQLDQEYEQGVWMTTPPTVERLKDARCTGNLWIDLVRHIGRSVLRESLDIHDFPRNPTVN